MTSFLSAARYAASLSLLILWSAPADARSLETVIERGTLTLCASPNALPFASKIGPVPTRIAGSSRNVGALFPNPAGALAQRLFTEIHLH